MSYEGKHQTRVAARLLLNYFDASKGAQVGHSGAWLCQAQLPRHLLWLVLCEVCKVGAVPMGINSSGVGKGSAAGQACNCCRWADVACCCAHCRQCWCTAAGSGLLRSAAAAPGLHPGGQLCEIALDGPTSCRCSLSSGVLAAPDDPAAGPLVNKKPPVLI